MQITLGRAQEYKPANQAVETMEVRIRRVRRMGRDVQAFQERAAEAMAHEHDRCGVAAMLVAIPDYVEDEA